MEPETEQGMALPVTVGRSWMDFAMIRRLAFVGEASVYGNGGYPLTCQINGYDTL